MCLRAVHVPQVYVTLSAVGFTASAEASPKIWLPVHIDV